MNDTDRWVRVSGYVDLDLDAVIHRFERPDIDAVLAAALARAVGSPDISPSVHGATPMRISSGNAHVGLSWRIDRGGAVPVQGTGAIALLRVQSGREPITELLVSVRVEDGDAGRVAASLHGFIEDLLERLPSLAA